MIPRLELESVSAPEALRQLATLGKFELDFAGKAPTESLGIYAANASVYDSLHLVCQAADLRLEIGDRVRVSQGPYQTEFQVEIFRLTGSFADANRTGADARLKAALAARGVQFPAGTDLRCEPDLGVVIIRHRPAELQKLRALLGE